MRQPVVSLARQRALAEPCDGRLLVGPPLELCLDDLAVAYVERYSVPVMPSRGIPDERGFVAHPYNCAVAVAHPVFVGHGWVGELALAGEDAIAILRAHLPSP
jgi:hypothetical protein